MQKSRNWGWIIFILPIIAVKMLVLGILLLFKTDNEESDDSNDDLRPIAT